MVAKLLPPNNIPVTKLSTQTGIQVSTLHGWKSKVLNKSSNTNKIKRNKKPLTAS